MTGFAVWEIVFSTNLFKHIYSDLQTVEQSMEANEETGLDNPQTIAEMDKVIKRWEKNKEILFCFGNTTLMRGVDEKLVALDTMIKKDHKDDAFVTLALAKSLIKAVMNDTHPVPTNLF